MAAIQQIWVVATKTIWPTKPKVFTIWTFKDKFADPCLRKESFFRNKSSLTYLLSSASFLLCPLLLPLYLTSILFFLLHFFISFCYKRGILHCSNASNTISWNLSILSLTSFFLESPITVAKVRPSKPIEWAREQIGIRSSKIMWPGPLTSLFLS